MARNGKTKGPRPPFKLGRFLWRAAVWTFIVVVLAPIALVLIYRFVPPPGTILMVQRSIEGKGWDYRWRPVSRISPAMVQAAVASEDARFCTHHGFDFEAIQKAMAHNERRPNRIRGGSTISHSGDRSRRVRRRDRT